MELSLENNTGDYYIQAYDDGQLKINDHIYTRSLIVTPTQLIDTWEPQSLAELTPQNLEVIAKLKPDVILLGSGISLCFPEASILASFYLFSIGIEIMDTGAACRTYNVLASEGRNVAAALLIR